MIGVSEALALGRRLGIDDKVLSNIMGVSSSRCWSIDTYNPVPGVMENVPSCKLILNQLETMKKDLHVNSC